ncbi:MAG: hypothetical protein JSV88_07150 [Candidatus Aminicenantes bacterium]|nr:MAG: hypothetical protein JSV88_07150 [Candidatus Aminicenantes bacterium]
MSKPKGKKQKHKRASEEGQLHIGLAWYRPEQWDLLLKMSVDSDELEPTYEEWLKMAEQRFQEMRQAGIQVEKIDVDMIEMVEWCASENIPLDGEARSGYVAEKLHKLDREKDSKDE